MERNLEKKLKRNIPLDYISVFITNLNMQNLVLVYKCGQEKLNNLYYQMKEQRRCSTWRKTKKSYTPEFKQQIVDLYNAGGTSYPQPEREYGVNRSTFCSVR